MILPRWFLLLNGVALLLMGGTLLYGRLRPQEEPGDPPDGSPWRARGGRGWRSPQRFFGLLWALLCCAVAAVLLLMAMGWLPQIAERPPPPRPRAPEFPTDR